MKLLTISCTVVCLMNFSNSMAMWKIFEKPNVSPEEYQVKLAAIENTYRACVKRCDFAPGVVITDPELQLSHKKETERCEYQCHNDKMGDFNSLNSAAKRTNGAKLTPPYNYGE